MPREQFADKKQALELIDKRGVIGPIDLVDHFGISYKGAAQRIYRLHKAGLIEPMKVEKGKWTLSPQGDNHLAYLRRRENDNRRSSTGGD